MCVCVCACICICLRESKNFPLHNTHDTEPKPSSSSNKTKTTLQMDCIGFGEDCWLCIGGPCDWFGSLTGGPPACLPNGTRPFGEYSFGVILSDRDCSPWVTTTFTTEAPSYGGRVWPVVFGVFVGIFLLMILLFAACVWAWKRSPHRAAAYAQIQGIGADGGVDAINDLLNDIVELDNLAQPAVPAAPAAVEEDNLEEVLVAALPAGVAVADVTPRYVTRSGREVKPTQRFKAE